MKYSTQSKEYKRVGKYWHSRLFVILLLIFTMPTGLYAQRSTVSGVVSDSGGPLAGVTVQAQGTNIGTTTGGDGVYSISVPVDAVLEFSYLGYETQVLPVASRSNIDVVLAEDNTVIDELVVVGYGVQKKSLVTGAISSIKSSDIEFTGIMRADEALAGKTAGVQVISNSGQPGSGIDIRIRGIGTNGNSSPTYVVDGMMVDGIEYLDPQSIQSIEILKDGAAAAIYGTAGGNGVVIITTKRGSEGTGVVNYSYSYGIQNVQRKIDVLNAREYTIIQNEAAINAGREPIFTQQQINSFNQGTDWQEALLYRNAPTQQHSVSFVGGTKISSYNLSGSYLSQDGVIAKGKSNFERYTGTLNAEHKFFKNGILTVGENVVVSRVNRQSVTQNSSTAGPLMGALNMDPLTPVYDPYQRDELYHGFGSSKYVASEVVNPVARIYFSNGESWYTTVKASVFAELKFLQDFRFRVSAGTDLTWNGSKGYTPIYKLNSSTSTTANGASMSMDQYQRMHYSGTLNWGHTYGSHDVSAMLGSELIQRSSYFISGNRNDLIIDDPEYAWLSMATSTMPGVSGGRYNPSALLSFFGRVNYSYEGRYMMTFTLRHDGSSRFGPKNRFVTLPSVSVGWNVHNEKFMQDVNWIDMLKLRVSWGQNGNQNIADFRYLSTISTSGLGYVFGSQQPNGDISTGAAPTRVVDESIKWEKGEQTNIGLDIVFLRNFNFTFEYYVKTTKGLHVDTPILLAVGNNKPVSNAGTVRNSGVEFTVGYEKKFRDFYINADANISFNKNKVTYVGTDTGLVEGVKLQGIDGEVTRMEEGHAMAYFRGYKTNGIFQNWDEVYAYTYTDPDTGVKKLIQPNASPGDFRFMDTNGDGTIDDFDKVDLGNPYPKAIYGINLNMAYKGFDFTVNTSGSYGAKIFSTLRRVDLPMSNYGAWVLDRWHGEGTSNTIPRVTHDDRNGSWSSSSDFYVHNGDYFRIRNVALGYTFSIPTGYYVSAVRVFCSVNNLYTFTKYNGYDPEIGGGSLSVGVDRGVYPRPRTVSFGINLTFK